jgi:catechol 2,3-dioxygenase-like lactoylglutathione lyase family enzyme
MRPLDHLVLPVADLAAARTRLSALGFTVAADGRHPFGTENCCVYFEDGTFLEPLAIADRDAYDQASRAGNRFVLGDREFRAVVGDEGFSAIVFGTDDAARDHAAFVEARISAGDMLDFSRPMVFPDGRSQTASFRLAFAGTGHPGDVFAFTCQRINVPAADRSALTKHEIFVTGIRDVVCVHDAPAEISTCLRAVTGEEGTMLEGGAALAFGGARINVLTQSLFADTYGLELQEGAGFTGRLVVFAVTSVAGLSAKFARAGIDHFMNGAMLLVPPAAGQSAAFAFSEV